MPAIAAIFAGIATAAESIAAITISIVAAMAAIDIILSHVRQVGGKGRKGK